MVAGCVLERTGNFCVFIYVYIISYSYHLKKMVNSRHLTLSKFISLVKILDILKHCLTTFRKDFEYGF